MSNEDLQRTAQFVATGCRVELWQVVISYRFEGGGVQAWSWEVHATLDRHRKNAPSHVATGFGDIPAIAAAECIEDAKRWRQFETEEKERARSLRRATKVVTS